AGPCSAGKAGPTQSCPCAWIGGYAPQRTSGVCVGYTKGRIPMHNIEGYANVVGGTLPAVIWHDFMSQALANVPVKGFANPSFQGYSLTPKGAQSPSPSPSPRPSKSPTPSPLPSPLSRTATRRVPQDSSRRTVTSVASACFFTFDRASWTTR